MQSEKGHHTEYKTNSCKSYSGFVEVPAMTSSRRNFSVTGALVPRGLIIFLGLCLTLPAWAGGIEVGSPIILKKKNQRFEGTLMRIIPDNEPLTIITQKSGNSLLWLKDVRRIMPTGEIMVITPSQADIPRHLSTNIMRFETLQGLSIEGGLLKWPSFEVEINGTRQIFLLRQLGFIETGTVQSASGLTIGSRVRSIVDGESIIGTVVGLNLFRPGDSITVVSPSGESVMILVSDLMRIQTAVTAPVPPTTLPIGKTGTVESQRLYNIFTVSGRKLQGRILTPPLFSIDTGKGIRKNVWSGLEVIEKQ